MRRLSSSKLLPPFSPPPSEEPSRLPPSSDPPACEPPAPALLKPLKPRCKRDMASTSSWEAFAPVEPHQSHSPSRPLPPREQGAPAARLFLPGRARGAAGEGVGQAVDRHLHLAL